MSSAVNRRAVTKAVAWALPAATVGAIAPAVAASLQDVTVTKPGTASITDGNLSFSICAVGADIGSGSTFTVSGATGATVNSGFTLSGSTITL